LCVEAALTDQLARRLWVCHQAVAEFHEALSQVVHEPQRAAEHIAVLHALAERAQQAFASFQAAALHD
jgi:hypothetical protein